MRRWFVKMVGLVAILTMAAGANAQQEKIASNGQWNAQCRTDRVSGKLCEVQTAYDIRKAPQANYWLTYGLKDRAFSLNGAPCPASARAWVDKQPAAEFEACAKCTCQMKAAESARLFDMARAGKALFIEVKDSKGVTAGPFESRLREFDKTYRAAAAANTAGK